VPASQPPTNQFLSVKLDFTFKQDTSIGKIKAPVQPSVAEYLIAWKGVLHGIKTELHGIEI
jgi:hypothetical protein